MARQKSTDRSEARRRHRAELSSTEAAAAEAAAAEALGVPTAPPAKGRAKAAPVEPAPGAKLGIVEAFRLASRPADIRGDIAAFPEIARTTKAVWLPAALIVLGGVLLLFEGLRSNFWVGLLASISVSPQPTMIPAFLAGMLTRRGSWLAGLAAGLISAAMFDLVYLLVPPEQIDEVDPSIFLTMIVLGPVFGAAVGAFAGFYRRFLAYSSPPRERRSSKARPKQARRR